MDSSLEESIVQRNLNLIDLYIEQIGSLNDMAGGKKIAEFLGTSLLPRFHQFMSNIVGLSTPTSSHLIFKSLESWSRLAGFLVTFGYSVSSRLTFQKVLY